MLKIEARYYRYTAWCVLAFLSILVLLTYRQYGITWDEELQSQYGLAVVDYYLSLFQDHRFDQIFNLYLYGGMFDGMASLIDRFTPVGLYESRHLLNAIMGLVGLWGIWRLGRLVSNGAVGLAALVMLALTPMYYGHMYNNPKDIPFAAGIIWSIYYMGRCLQRKPAPCWPLVVKLGIVYGLTLGVRVGGVMLVAFWIMLLGIDILLQWRRQNFATAWRTFATTTWRMVLPVLLISYAVMLLCWPWAQEHPILNPLRALSEFSNFPQDVDVLLDGVTYRSTQLPWFYVPLYFGVQLPEFLLVLLGFSLVALPSIWRGLSPANRQLLALILMMMLVPPLYAMLRHPALYDAVRHFLFVAPLACVLAALTLRRVCIWAVSCFGRQSSRNIIAASIALLVVIASATQIYLMERLHPYEYIFINRFAGGVAGAYGHYELDYWGSSFKEAAEDLQKFVADEGGVPPGKIYKVAICGPWSAAMIYLPPDYEPVVANEPAEFFLSTTRWMCQKMRPGHDIIEIKRRGAPLAVIKDLRDGYEYYDGNSKKK